MILNDFKEYIKEMYGINARYKMLDSAKDDYQEQNIVVIYPKEINYTTNDTSGILGVELIGQLSLYITEGRTREDFLFEKMFINQKDKKFNCIANFSINHWNEEILEISCDFTFKKHYELKKNKKKLRDIEFDVVMNK